MVTGLLPFERQMSTQPVGYAVAGCCDVLLCKASSRYTYNTRMLQESLITPASTES